MRKCRYASKSRPCDVAEFVVFVRLAKKAGFGEVRCRTCFEALAPESLPNLRSCRLPRSLADRLLTRPASAT